MVTRARVATTSVIVIASVLLALVTPAFIPAFASTNSHALQVQCVGSGVVINYPSGWVTNSTTATTVNYGGPGNGTYVIINFPPGIVSSFNYTESSGNTTTTSHGYMINLTNNTYGIVIHSWNSTSCQGTLVKG